MQVLLCDHESNAKDEHAQLLLPILRGSDGQLLKLMDALDQLRFGLVAVDVYILLIDVEEVLVREVLLCLLCNFDGGNPISNAEALLVRLQRAFPL